ncbi:hypothetical protein BU17DRAFT_62327 [Hysterangium stoloniferum]|nr:hypothetical protein BU17DRAFT_62327 [Hysterangium stoloniferum]
MPSTTPHRVHNIPDITSIVFKCLNVETSLNHALVCKAWLEPALDEMWWYINQPWRYSAAGILPCAWTRFDYYARRIRCLLYQDDGSSELEADIDVSVLVEIARARPKLILLPHLQHLAWYSIHFGYATLFIHSELSNLEISIEADLMDEHAFKEAGTFLYEYLLRSLRRLEELGLPRYWITTSVLATVAALPCLEAIRSDIYGHCKGDIKDVEIIDDFSPQEGSFPVFNILIFDISFTCATKLFQNATFPARLTRLWINAIDFVVPSTLHNFLQLCAAGYPALIALGFDLFPNDPDSFIPSGEITLETLKPLLSRPTIE